MDALHEELTRLVCPDPEHQPPCPVPWAAHHVDGEEGAEPDAVAPAGEDESDEHAYLERQYGHLFQRGRAAETSASERSPLRPARAS